MPGITTILTVYRRPRNLLPQVEAIRKQTVPPQAIWAWANDPADDLQAALTAAGLNRVVSSSQNAFFHGRFALALLATTEYVALFDDDTIPGTEWFANCLETMETTPGILGTAGVVLHGPGYANRTMYGWQRPGDGVKEVDLVGQAWFLRTEWLKHLFSSAAVTGTNGEDIELAARACRLDGVRSFCPPHPAGKPQRWGSIAGMQLGCDEQASSLRTSHADERDRIVMAELSAGWKPLFMRQPATAAPRKQESADGKSGTLDLQSPKVPPVRVDAMVSAVPISASRILDCRPGDGQRAAALKQRHSCEVVGLVRTEFEANAPGEQLDRTVIGNVEAIDAQELQGPFDCIVLDGVLERSRSPAKVFERVRSWLAPDGQVIARVTNVGHQRNVKALLDGVWDRVANPAMGDRELRFFTRSEVEKLFFRQGMRINDLHAESNADLESWKSNGSPLSLATGEIRFTADTTDDIEERLTERFIITATAATKPAYGLTSIVLVTFNQLAYTRGCLESIRWRTDEPYELIVVDNGSTDGSVAWLREQADVRLIENDTNRGFPAAANQGIKASRGDQILLLNNDTVVTTGWLESLLAALHSDDRVGLAGPCSNYVSGPQQIPGRYDDLAALDGFAWKLRRANLDRREESDRLVGFCLLIKRKLIDQIGLLDERFGIGNFEDDDFCLRAIRAGYRALIARDSFVHHFGGRTFVGAGVDFSGLMQTNAKLFRDKWGSSDATGNSPAGAGASSALADKASIAPEPGSPVRLSLFMIVRDNARTIRACLESIRPWVDEIVVVDTGSLDATAAICRELGARVYHHPWPDSFSAARNLSLGYARGEWVFWMDSDDTIPEACGRKLRALVDGPHDPGVLGYVMQVHCPAAGRAGEHDVTVVDHLKLFRNRPDLRFEFRIHEQIIPAIRRAGGGVCRTDIYVVHSGADHTPEGRARKLKRDLRLLQMDLDERPNHPFVLFNLGMTHADAGQHDQAVDFLEQAIDAAAPDESQLRKAYALLVASHRALDHQDKAWDVCQEGLKLFPHDPELRFHEAMCHQLAKRWSEAEKSYRAALANDDKEHFSSIDRGIVGFKARQNLAEVYAQQGAHDKAETEWRAITHTEPHYRDGWCGLAECLLKQGRSEAALASLSGLSAGSYAHVTRLLIQATIAEARYIPHEARLHLTEAERLASDDADVLQALAQHLFFHGTLEEAERAVKALLKVQPDDAASWHNLGTIHFRAGRFQEADVAYQRSLALRPDYQPTLQLAERVKLSANGGGNSAGSQSVSP